MKDDAYAPHRGGAKSASCLPLLSTTFVFVLTVVFQANLGLLVVSAPSKPESASVWSGRFSCAVVI